MSLVTTRTQSSDFKRWLAGTRPSRPIDVGWAIRVALEKGIDISRFQTFNPIYDLSQLMELTYEKRLA